MKIERVKRELSQAELAQIARVALGDLSRIETGRMRPYPNQAERLSSVLGIGADELQKPVELAETVGK
jgi:transcriptional regulator with XRE-family HTH domain